jgi:hypothetical protein
MCPRKEVKKQAKETSSGNPAAAPVEKGVPSIGGRSKSPG